MCNKCDGIGLINKAIEQLQELKILVITGEITITSIAIIADKQEKPKHD